ncbi:hypothetical protein THAOC_10913, partial [Thalassiosira oceanica]
MDGNKFIAFTPLCLAVEFYGPLTYSDSFDTNSMILEITMLNPENQPNEYLNDATPMSDMINLDAVKIEYRKVS